MSLYFQQKHERRYIDGSDDSGDNGSDDCSDDGSDDSGKI